MSLKTISQTREVGIVPYLVIGGRGKIIQDTLDIGLIKSALILVELIVKIGKVKI